MAAWLNQWRYARAHAFAGDVAADDAEIAVIIDSRSRRSAMIYVPSTVGANEFSPQIQVFSRHGNVQIAFQPDLATPGGAAGGTLARYYSAQNSPGIPNAEFSTDGAVMNAGNMHDESYQGTFKFELTIASAKNGLLMIGCD